jgi:hypothetical protein
MEKVFLRDFSVRFSYSLLYSPDLSLTVAGITGNTSSSRHDSSDATPDGSAYAPSACDAKPCTFYSDADRERGVCLARLMSLVLGFMAMGMRACLV